jgi:hypothetical protein
MRCVIDKGDIDGLSLLHKFASSGMPHCVQALLSNNAPLNALNYKYRRDHDQEKEVKISWFETPLDSAFVARERKIQEMQRESVHTLEENEDILTKLERVIHILQEAGDICTRHEVKTEPFLFDQSKYGKRGFVRALRECRVEGKAAVVRTEYCRKQSHYRESALWCSYRGSLDKVGVLLRPRKISRCTDHP